MKTLICYSFEKIDPVRRKRFDRKMFGTVEITHKGKYKTQTKGLLTNIEYKRPVRSVIVIDEKYISKVMAILDEFSAKVIIYKIKPFNYKKYNRQF